MAAILIYEVECTLDPDIVADFDAWLPGHVREVLACAGFLGATIESPETPAGERQKRMIRYRIENAAALDHYLENNATRLRTDAAQRFGARVQCVRRLLKPRQELTPAARESPRCLNCGSLAAGNHCAQCGQAADVHVLSMREVAGDVTHSLLHLDSRVWRTLRRLALQPGELTREFIAGRHLHYLPPFRLYLAISILFFALSALLPDQEFTRVDEKGNTVIAPVSVDVPREARQAQVREITEDLRKKLEAEGADPADIDKIARSGRGCELNVFGDPRFDEIEAAFNRACERMRADGGARFAERFAATAPKLMFIFLPVMAAVALLFYWRPRRLYAEHLVLFLHNHAFTFLLVAVTQLLGAVANLPVPLIGVLHLVGFLMYLYLPYYVFRSMRVVYAEGRLKTTLKFLSLVTIYFVLLGVTMLAGLVYTMLALA